MRRKTPQEKKQLSYERDRRNTYGESPHGSRRAIPLRKALRNRANRRLQNQVLENPVVGLDVGAADELESKLRHRKLNDWGKYPDEPLGVVIERKLRNRHIMRTQGGRDALRKRRST